MISEDHNSHVIRDNNYKTEIYTQEISVMISQVETEKVFIESCKDTFLISGTFGAFFYQQQINILAVSPCPGPRKLRILTDVIESLQRYNH